MLVGHRKRGGAEGRADRIGACDIGVELHADLPALTGLIRQSGRKRIRRLTPVYKRGELGDVHILAHVTAWRIRRKAAVRCFDVDRIPVPTGQAACSVPVLHQIGVHGYDPVHDEVEGLVGALGPVGGRHGDVRLAGEIAGRHDPESHVASAAAEGDVGCRDQIDVGGGRAERQFIDVSGIGVAYGKVSRIGCAGVGLSRNREVVPEYRSAAGRDVYKLQRYPVELRVAALGQCGGQDHFKLSGCRIDLRVDPA